MEARKLGAEWKSLVDFISDIINYYLSVAEENEGVLVLCMKWKWKSEYKTYEDSYDEIEVVHIWTEPNRTALLKQCAS
jgi:hypothetical protein